MCIVIDHEGLRLNSDVTVLICLFSNLLNILNNFIEFILWHELINLVDAWNSLGGPVQDMAWDSNGERLAVSFMGMIDFVNIFFLN